MAVVGALFGLSFLLGDKYERHKMGQPKLFTVLITLALLVATVVGCVTPSPTPTLPPKPRTMPPAPTAELGEFLDENLEAAIRDALGKPAGEPITPAELAGLTELRSSGLGITHLSGIEYCINLTTLTLDNNQINDISPLVENSGLGVGDEVWLEDNNLELWEGSEDMDNIRALGDRRVVVHYS